MSTMVPALKHVMPGTTVRIYVVYARFLDDKKDGVRLAGVHYGGQATSFPAADTVARECINGIKGGTILTRLFPVSTDGLLQEVMREAERWFKIKEREMQESSQILNRKRER